MGVSWGGGVDTQKRLVSVDVDEIGSILDGDVARLAVIGIICVDCLEASLKKVHEPTTPSRNALVLVHGLASGESSYQDLIDDIRLTDSALQTWLFSYPSFRSFRLNAVDFNNLLEIHSEEFDRVDIVSHSLGGMVVQQGLYDAVESKGFTYVDKVGQVILIATPNEGSPAAQLYVNLFRYLVNIKTVYNLFRLDSIVLSELVQGAIIPRVDGVDYKVIAGTKPFDFNLGFFETTSAQLLDIIEPNDGLITVKSAQHVGDSYINNSCSDFFELYLSHTELTKGRPARKLIGKLLAEGVEDESEELGLLGQTSFYQFAIDGCTPSDAIVVIGKPISRREVYDPALCSCGNGVCGVGENIANCAEDCDVQLGPSRNLLPFLLAFVILLAFAIFMYTSGKSIAEKLAEKYKKELRALKQRFAKKEEEGHVTVHQIMDQQLNTLQDTMHEKSIDDLAKEFTNTIRQYFKTVFNVEYEFTYEEFLEELNKKDIDARLKKVLISFFKRIPQIEFGGTQLTKQELQSLIDEMHEIVNATSGIVAPHDELRKQLKKVQGKGLDRIYQLISNAEIYLRMGEVREAARIFATVKRAYDGLREADKHRLYDQVQRLYDEIKLGANRIRKNE